MEKTKILDYAYMRTEADNTYTLFLDVEPSLIGKEFDISLTDNKELQIAVPGEVPLKTKVLSDDIYYVLANQTTPVIFMDNDVNALAKYDLPPLNPQVKSSKKLR
jgi:hypothetical protein